MFSDGEGSPGFSAGPKDFLYLLEVIDIVPGKHAHNVLDGFLSAFRVYATVFPLRGPERLKE